MRVSFAYRNKLILLAVLVFLFACSKDEIESPLTGSWESVRFTASEPVDENQDGVAHTDLKLENECVSMKAEFTAHGRFSIISSDTSYKVEIVDGNVVITPNGCTSTTETGHWSLDETSSLLSLEFDIPGKDEATLVDVSIDLSDRRLVLKELPYSDDPPITFDVEFDKK